MLNHNANLEHWLAMQHSKGVGAATFRKYLMQDPCLNNLPSDLQIDHSAVQRDLNWLKNNSAAHIITLADNNYPLMLKHIPDPPPLLYAIGDINCLMQPQIAIVGSRAASKAGLIHAERFAEQFASLGIVITSGLAIGIDSASHKAALKNNKGKTVAVLAHGLDLIYPERHIPLSRQIIEQGCLVSEFPIGTKVWPQNFPQRNRIISGLSIGVLIIEAAINSGSLITAQFAIEQNREVFALPGSIDSPKMRGCHKLIRDGAKLVESSEDVLQELANLLKYVIRDRNSVGAKVKNTQGLSAQQQGLLEFIDYDSTCVDEIVDYTGLSSSAVGAILFELELNGLITAVPGGYARTLD